MQTNGRTLLSAAAADVPQVSAVTNTAYLSAASMMVTISGGDGITGSALFEGSNDARDPTQWFLIPSGSVSITGNGVEGSPPVAVTYRWVRVSWVPSAGSGGTITVDAYFQGGPSPSPPTSTSGGAPIDAQYVTLSANSTLTNERVLTAGTGITLVDGGPGTTVTASLETLSPSPAGAYTNASVTVDSRGRVTTASSGSAINSTTATVNFGTTDQQEASVTVAAAWVGASTRLTVSPLATATAEHDPDDYAVEGITASIQNIVAGVGFDVLASAPNGTFGRYNFAVIGVG